MFPWQGTLLNFVLQSTWPNFAILKALNINIHPPKAPLIIEVLWIPPLFNWLKINTDGAYIKNSAKAACGGIVRDAMGACIGCFAQDIPNCTSAFFAEIFAVIVAIELAVANHWMNLWLETDSKLVLLACKDASMVPWIIRNRLYNCMEATNNMLLLLVVFLGKGTLVQMV